MLVFVYGTLKSDQRAYELMLEAKAEFVKVAKTSSDFSIFVVNGSFPTILRTESGIKSVGVSGELYEIDPKNMKELDEYEGYPNLFRKEIINLDDGTEATAYLLNNPEAFQLRLIESGNFPR